MAGSTRTPLGLTDEDMLTRPWQSVRRPGPLPGRWLVAASVDPNITVGEIIDVREESTGPIGTLLGLYATRAGDDERVGQLQGLNYVLAVTDELPGCLLVKDGATSPRLLLAPPTGEHVPIMTTTAKKTTAIAKSSASSGSRSAPASPASSSTSSNKPKCQYRGCRQTDHLELCALDGRRVACPAHRTLRGGSYICKSCDEEIATEEARRRAQSHHTLLLFGSIASIVLGILVLWVFGPNVGLETRAARDDLLIVVITVLIVLVAGVGLYRTDAFRIGRMGQLDGLEVGVYWLAAIPAFLVFSVVVIGLLMLGGFAKEEYSVQQDREWIRRRTENL